ncbi:MAG: LamG-like jellyroll fold domain-containing protein [Verrucomicrobiota bacterium]
MKNTRVLLLCLCLTPLMIRAADVREGLVSYWPFETLSADQLTTPDVVTGNNLLLNNMDASALVTGKKGKAVEFDGDVSQRHLYYLKPEGEDRGLPISRGPTYSILFWVKGKGTGQSDRRLFAESSSLDTDPLVDLGTHNAGTDDSVDIFVRNAGNPINHAHSPTMALNDEWHHIAWTYDNGPARLYIDGNLDYTNNFVLGATPFDTTSIGAVVRLSSGTPIQYFFTGLIDEVAVWERALSPAEIQDVMNNGIQTPVPIFPPGISLQPVGSTNLILGDSYSLRAQATGRHPLTYQWRKDNTAISGAVGTSLLLTNLAATDSGDYTFIVSGGGLSLTSQVAKILVGAPPPPNLTNDMVAYWPLDEVQGTKTPDVIRGYDMNMINLTEADLVPGKWGKALKFTPSRITILERENSPNDLLSLYPKSTNLTVSLWVNGAPNQQDKRVFSESSSTANNPLFNIGTHNTAVDGTVDTYIRTDTGATSGDHRHSLLQPYDGTWHHIVYVQREPVAGSPVGVLYVDGVRDESETQPGPVRPVPATVTSIGGVRRGSSGSPNRQFVFDGLIDDVALWRRALSEEEIRTLFAQGTPKPGSIAQPLAIRSFKANLPAVAKSDAVTLTWDVSKDATQIEIDGGIGDVTGRTVVGLGSTNVVISQSAQFTLTVRRGTETVTTNTSVAAIEGIANNWALLDNFDRYAVGISQHVLGGPGGNSQVIDVNGNRMLDIRGAGRLALLGLSDLTVKEGQQRTLFARIYVQGDPSAAVRSRFGLTDRGLRFPGDVVDAGGAGPSVFPSNEGGDLMLGAKNGVGAAIDFLPPVLESNQVYNVWLDVKNDPVASGDVYSVWLAKEGDAQRTQLFADYISDRDPNGDPAASGGSRRCRT